MPIDRGQPAGERFEDAQAAARLGLGIQLFLRLPRRFMIDLANGGAGVADQGHARLFPGNEGRLRLEAEHGAQESEINFVRAR